MASFRYRGRGRRGDMMEGALEAASADAVASQLMNSGITPIEISEVQPQLDVASLWRQIRGPVPPDLAERLIVVPVTLTVAEGDAALDALLTRLSG
jgi:MSHA biogenesis protein MshG